MTIMEHPVPIAFVGTLVVVALVSGLIRTGRWALLYAAIFAGLATLGLLIAERLTVTPREEVKATLHVIADLLERNDTRAVLDYVSRGRPALRDDAHRKLGMVEFIDVDVKPNLKVELHRSGDADFAEARFNAVARVRDRRGMTGESVQPRYFVVNFRREDGVWRVRDYEVRDPRQGI